MKKIIALLSLVFIQSAFSATCYFGSPILSILHAIFMAEINIYEEAVLEMYDEINKEMVDDIVTEIETKNATLGKIQNLISDSDLSQTEQVHLLGIKKELKSVLIDMWGIE